MLASQEICKLTEAALKILGLAKCMLRGKLVFRTETFVMEYHLKKIINYPNLPQRFLKARDSLMEHFRPILNHFGVTEQQWRILRALDEHGQLEPREICEMYQFSSPSMAGMLARMEEVGLVERGPILGDQRRVMVCLSKKGVKLLSQVGPLIDLQYSYLEQACGKKIFSDLFTVLDEFIDITKRPVKQVLP
jgi:homoprotocatechuate degradation regulator HpaR